MTHIRNWTKDSHKGMDKDLTKVLSMAILRREEDEEENEIL
jgi:hypothetical protein